MGRESILIVEDSPLSRKLAEAQFEAEGYEVWTASTASEGLALLRRFRPDVVLTDLRLPDMDGLEFARRIKADPATRDLVVLATSAEHDVPEGRIRDAGCDGFIPKPIEVERVRERISSLQGNPQAARSPREAREPDAAAQEPLRQEDVTERIRRTTRKLGLESSDPWLAEFLSESARDFCDLRRAAAEEDAPRVRTIAHRMAGPSGMIGASRVAEACLALDGLATSGSLDRSTARLLDRLEKELEAMRVALRELDRDGAGR